MRKLILTYKIKSNLYPDLPSRFSGRWPGSTFAPVNKIDGITVMRGSRDRHISGKPINLSTPAKFSCTMLHKREKIFPQNFINVVKDVIYWVSQRQHTSYLAFYHLIFSVLLCKDEIPLAIFSFTASIIARFSCHLARRKALLKLTSPNTLSVSYPPMPSVMHLSS